MMLRRDFLKALGIGGLTLAAGGGGGIARYMQQESSDAAKLAASTDPDAASKRRANFISFIERPASSKLVGVDHALCEKDLLDMFAHPDVIAALKKKGHTKVYFETPAFLQGLYDVAPEMTAQAFEMVYRDAYPNNSPSALLAAEHKAICALQAAGLALVPYDRRFRNDPDTRRSMAENVAHLNQARQDVLEERQGLIGLLKLGAAYLLGGVEKRMETRSDLDRAAREEMRQAHDRTYEQLEGASRVYFAEDGQNLAFIQSQQAAGEPTLVCAGRSHLSRPGALGSLMKGAGPTDTLMYFDDSDIASGKIASEIEGLDSMKETRPDFVLSYKTGLLKPVGAGQVRPQLAHPVSRPGGKAEHLTL